MKTLLVRALLILCLALSCGATMAEVSEDDMQMPNTPEQLLSAGFHYMEISAAEDAVGAFREVISRYPGWERTCWAQWGLATCYYHDAEPKYNECITECDNILATYPDNALICAWAFRLKGDAYMRLGDYSEAIDLLCGMVKDYKSLDDQLPVDGARVLVGRLYRSLLWEKTDDPETPALIEKLKANAPSEAWLLGCLASGHAYYGEFDTARKYYNQLTTEYPNKKFEIAWTARALGGEFARDKRTGTEREELMNWLSTPAALLPEDAALVAGAQYQIAKYLRDQEHDNKGAAEVIEAALKAYPSIQWEPDMRYLCGTALMAENDFVGAAVHLQVLADKHKDKGFSTAAVYKLGSCLLSMNKPAKARAKFEEVFEDRGEIDWRIMAEPRIADCYAAEKNYEKAAEIMSRAAKRAAAFSGSGVDGRIQPFRKLCQDQRSQIADVAARYAKLAAKQKGDVKQ